MLRLLLPLLILFVSVVAPVDAACRAYVDNTQAGQMCCCSGDLITDSNQCAETSSSCCSFNEGNVPAAPQPYNSDAPDCVKASPSHAASISQARGLALATSRREHELLKPLHLASNKLYLQKRSLLI